MVIGLVVVAVLAVLMSSNLGSSGGIPASANIPPVGGVWFGSSFDPKTFELRGTTTSIGTNQSFSLVAHLRQPIDGSKLVIRISLDGHLVATTPANASGTGDVWGFSPGPLFSPGTWTYQFADIGGNVLASGSVTAR